MNILKIFKIKKDTQPLPVYEKIEIEQIPAASILLFYGGNKLTEMVGNNLYNHPYRPPAFHAAFYCENGLFLNVGKFRIIEEVTTELRSTRRVDVLILKGLSSVQREVAIKFAFLDSSKPKVGIELPDYSWTDYLRFGFKFLKPSKKDFCSENVVELFEKVGVKVSDKKAVDTAPWDLFGYAIANSDKFDIKTLHVGDQFVA